MIFGRKTETQQQSGTRASFANPNRREKTDKCELCQNKFSIMLKQHECKRCLRAICFYCGNNKATIPSYDPKNIHRVCNVCNQEMLLINSNKKKFQMTFGRNSIQGTKWLRYLLETDRIEEEKLDKEFNEVMQRVMKGNNQKIKTLIQSELLSTLTELKQLMNYSFYDTHVTYMSKENEDILQLKVTSVLMAFYDEFPQVMNKTLVGLILFLLYFCSESFTYKALQILHRDVIPQRFQYHKINNTIKDMQAKESEVLVIQEMLKQTNLIDQNDFNHIIPLMEDSIIQILSSVFLNYLTFSSSYIIFDLFIKRKQFYELERAFATLILLHSKALKNIQVRDFQDFILKATDIKKFQELYTKEDKFKLQLSTPEHTLMEDSRLDNQENVQQESFTDNRIESTKSLNVSEFVLLQNLYIFLTTDSSEYKLEIDEEMSENQKLYVEILKKIKQIKDNGLKANKEFLDLQTFSDQKIAQLNNNDEHQNIEQDRKYNRLLKEKEDEIEDLKGQLSKEKNYTLELETEVYQMRKGKKTQQNLQEQDEIYQVQINQLKKDLEFLETKHKEVKNQLDVQKNLNSDLNEEKKKIQNKNFDINQLNSSLLKQLKDLQQLNKEISEENQLVKEAYKIEVYKNQKSQENPQQQTSSDDQSSFKLEETYKNILQNMKDEIIRRQREIYDLRIEKIQFSGEQLRLQDNLERCEIQIQDLKQKVEKFQISQDVERIKSEYEEIIRLMKEQQIQQMNNLMSEFQKQD